MYRLSSSLFFDVYSRLSNYQSCQHFRVFLLMDIFSCFSYPLTNLHSLPLISHVTSHPFIHFFTFVFSDVYHSVPFIIFCCLLFHCLPHHANCNVCRLLSFVDHLMPVTLFVFCFVLFFFNSPLSDTLFQFLPMS